MCINRHGGADNFAPIAVEATVAADFADIAFFTFHCDALGSVLSRAPAFLVIVVSVVVKCTLGSHVMALGDMLLW